MHLDLWIASFYVFDDAPRVPLRKRRLRRNGQLCCLRGCKLQSVYIGLVFNEAYMSWHFTQDAFGFRVSLFANVQDVVALLYQVAYKIVCDDYIGAGGIDAVQTTFACSAFYKRRNTMSGEDNGTLAN